MEQIEGHIRDVFDEIGLGLPETNHFTIEVTKYKHKKETAVYGFLHVGGVCTMYHSIGELKTIIAEKKELRAKNEILFRKFSLGDR